MVLPGAFGKAGGRALSAPSGGREQTARPEAREPLQTGLRIILVAAQGEQARQGPGADKTLTPKHQWPQQGRYMNVVHGPNSDSPGPSIGQPKVDIEGCGL